MKKTLKLYNDRGLWMEASGGITLATAKILETISQESKYLKKEEREKMILELVSFYGDYRIQRFRACNGDSHGLLEESSSRSEGMRVTYR